MLSRLPPPDWPAHLAEGEPLANHERLPCPDCASTGNTRTAKLRLLAYLGHVAARGVDGWRLCDPPPCYLRCEEPAWHHPIRNSGMDNAVVDRAPLGSWLERLPRLATWDPERASAVAALAAARVAHEDCECLLECGCSPDPFVPEHQQAAHGGCEIDAALEAADAWIVHPSEEQRKVWRKVVRGLSVWVPYPNWPSGNSLLRSSLDSAERIQAAAYMVGHRGGEDAVRTAICERLIAWTLEEL